MLSSPTNEGARFIEATTDGVLKACRRAAEAIARGAEASSMLAAAVDDELTASRGARRTAFARVYSNEMRALTHLLPVRGGDQEAQEARGGGERPGAQAS